MQSIFDHTHTSSISTQTRKIDEHPKLKAAPREIAGAVPIYEFGFLEPNANVEAKCSKLFLLRHEVLRLNEDRSRNLKHIVAH